MDVALDGQAMIGRMASVTVTVAEQVPVRAAASVTVSVTVLAPNCAQVNVVVDKAKPKAPVAVQLSLDPLFTVDAVVLALPEPFKAIVTGWQTAIGLVRSATVIVIALLVAVMGNAQGSLEVTTQVTTSPVVKPPLV